MNMDDRQARALGPGQLAQPAFVKAKAGMGCLTLRDRTKTGRGIDIEDRHFNQAIPHRKRRPTQHLLIDPHELGKDTPVLLVKFARLAALDELLDRECGVEGKWWALRV